MVKELLNEKSPSSESLVERLAAWMATEGYPTEFRAANLFRKHGFHARQGEYVEGESEDIKREIDVLASATVNTDFGFLRVSYVVECKWSLDKPWIVFTSPTNIMARSAMIAQTISSKLGASVMWAIAGHDDLSDLETFVAPRRGGFGGRQAFSKGNDHFYSAIQSVVANAKSYASWYDSSPRKPGIMPEACVITFPTVVVEGELFEAHFDENTDKVVLEPASHIRCHWRGSAAWSFFATVDIVSLRHLDAFLTTRSKELWPLIATMKPALKEIEQFRRDGSKKAISVTNGPRGFRGVPPLLQEFYSVNRKQEKLGSEQ